MPVAPPKRLLASTGQSRVARGEGLLWLCGGALVLCIVMVLGLLALVCSEGLSTFWPVAIEQVRLADGRRFLGEVTRSEGFRPEPTVIAALPAELQGSTVRALAASAGLAQRTLLRTGNFELSNEHYTWVPDFLVTERTRPEWAVVVERQAWGRFYGFPAGYRLDGKVVAEQPAEVLALLRQYHADVRARFQVRERMRNDDLGRLSNQEETARLRAHAVELRSGAGSEAHQRARADAAAVQRQCAGARAAFAAQVAALDRENARHQLVLRTIDGRQQTLELQDVVRLYPGNQLDFTAALGVYLDRWREFLLDQPRESNSEGGVMPAIVGTVLMTLLMSLCVLPLGVLAALYIREYARAGTLISAVRIAVNNLAGVPSIVFGVFGLGFFCYVVGGSIDALFYPERPTSPTFGKGALVWAALTLALLTLPVVIVATEEALAAVPGSMREGSYACGASKWQTIRRIVLPRAMPGIMTGAILAMARGAGEVAPLMLVGAVKLAPELPLDSEWPLLHPSRSFMHLGFNVFDLGFQSPNSEASKPMVFTTTLLLITVITLLNVAAVWLRSRLRARFVGAQF